MNKLIVITGQTATGKTKLALDLAKKYNTEIINCDSRQIYKYLDIVTGKDILNNSKFYLDHKLNGFDIGFYSAHLINIWLYDIVSPNQYFSSFDFAECAKYVINKLFEQEKTPIIVGGTYFYLHHLLYGINTEKIPPNFKLRNKLNNKSVLELQNILKDLSPKLFEELNNSEKNNPQRLVRKIEIVNSGNRDVINHISSNKIHLHQNIEINNVDISLIGLYFKNKDDMRKAIINRVEKRLKNGAIEETENILSKGYTEINPGLKTIGYKQLIDYLKGRKAKEEAINEWITKEIQYAKRQYTFMKRDKNIKWKEI